MAPPGWAPPGTPPIVVPAAPPSNRKKAVIWAVLGALGVIVLCVAAAGVIGVNLGSRLAANALKRTPTTAPLLSGSVTPFANTPAGEQVIFQDTLMSGATGWPDVAPKCFYQGDGYHVADGYWCYSPVAAISDVTVSVDAEQISGSVQAPYGIILRSESPDYYYEFDLYSDGQWGFGRSTHENPYIALIWPQTSSAIKSGLHASNHLMVRAKGTHFEFFINGTKVGEADDSTFTSGRSGLVCNQQGEAVFTNFQMTKPAA
jgi:hypothetical protein